MCREPPKHWIAFKSNRIEKQNWNNLYPYRELFTILGRRDISIRYNQTFIGVAWDLILPFLTMLVFTVIFDRPAKLPTEVIAPCRVLTFAGVLILQFYSMPPNPRKIAN